MIVVDVCSFLRDRIGVKEEYADQFAAHVQVRRLEKNRVFHRVGTVNFTVDFLYEGLVRGFFLDHAGKEITDCFAFVPGAPLVSSFTLQEPSMISLEAMVPTTICSIPTEYLLPFLQDGEIARLYNRFLVQSLRMHWENKIMLMQCTAKERYLWFMEHYPGIIDKVSHKYIASFLGMTPVSLSRIRRELREEAMIEKEELAAD